MDKTIFTEYFAIRLLINAVSMIILIRIIYYKVYNRKDLFTPFFLLNFIIFLLAYMLKVSGGFDSMGSAFGLLAAFSLLRFRTSSLTMKDMTYLFIVMTVGLINSVLVGNYTEIIAVNGVIITAVFATDGNILMRGEKTKTIEIESLQYIKPEHKAELLKDIKERTGLDIQKITIEHIDFVRNRASITVYYY
ncbi:MAG TPA: DUF4956 domain-containing protein [Cyclobacteriaceae bacterium]|nr:DUF4956 domain-containing protein [Cyclobacteriaceae bacterium]